MRWPTRSRAASRCTAAPAENPRRLPPGRIAGEFLLLYSAGRIVSECFRSAEDGHVLGLTAGQFWTLPLAALGLFLVLRSSRAAE